MVPRPGVPEYAVKLIREAIGLLEAGEKFSKRHGNLETYVENIPVFSRVRGYDTSGLERMTGGRRNGSSPNDCRQAA